MFYKPCILHKNKGTQLFYHYNIVKSKSLNKFKSNYNNFLSFVVLVLYTKWSKYFWFSYKHEQRNNDGFLRNMIRTNSNIIGYIYILSKFLSHVSYWDVLYCDHKPKHHSNYWLWNNSRTFNYLNITRKIIVNTFFTFLDLIDFYKHY